MDADALGKGFMAIFGGIIVVAIIAVIVGQKSQAPAAIQAASGALAQIVQAAVSPAGTNAANPVTNNQQITSPSALGSNVGNILGQFPGLQGL